MIEVQGAFEIRLHRAIFQVATRDGKFRRGIGHIALDGIQVQLSVRDAFAARMS